MKKIVFVLAAILAASATPGRGQTRLNSKISTLFERSENPILFPKHWVRGFVDFAVAPSHNEPDLGRCAFPQAPNSGGLNTLCTAYARYLLSGYVELQPLARTPARHIFFFFEPKISFGHNIPQLSYAASMEPIAYDRSIGVGFQLPKNFELRATQHQVTFLGRYGSSLGPSDLHTTGPYGMYATVGVRWSFGGYGRSGSPSPY